MVHVRLPLVNRDFLMTRVDCERLVREDSQCRELLLEAMRYHLAPERRCALSTTRTLERKPKGALPYLFAVGKLFFTEFKVLVVVGFVVAIVNFLLNFDILEIYVDIYLMLNIFIM